MKYLVLGLTLLGLSVQAAAQECGQRKARNTFVIGGEDAQRGDWPWQALFLTTSGKRSFCGGSLINKDWVVTAAHCVAPRRGRSPKSPSSITVRLGETDRTKREGSEVDIVLSRIIYHPSFSWYNLNNDIALVKLSRSVTFNDYIQPICLAANEAADGSECYITGWGKMRHPGNMVMKLQQGLLHKQSRSACSAYNGRTIRIPVTKQMICGAQPGTRLSGCHGDSGGPYVCKNGARWELNGAVSWGSSRCDSKQTYTVFANIAHFKGWIEQQIGGGSGSGSGNGVVKWRTDNRCGKQFPLPNGTPAECNPNANNHCCSNHGWCGGSSAHCNCRGCKDFSKTTGNCVDKSSRCPNYKRYCNHSSIKRACCRTCSS